MFLKRIELQGFKSFADKVIITFDSDVIGIVGPNGCGKSNINDAIRWVLGEQSVKSLRGNNMSDVIFSGSQQRKAVNTAEVKLVFDNSKHYLNVEYEEVEVVRRLHRTSGEGEYFINKTPCRLKDIQNMVMDSGLGKDSLSIISQGNISSFADAKPEERRALFEEAAGVAKYKKRKNESLNKLNRTQDNLMRLEDIIIELERQVNPLKRQAKRATIYLEKKSILEKIEISVICDEIETLNSKIETLKKKAFDLDSKKVINETTIQVHDLKNQELKKEMSTLDREVATLQETWMKINNEITRLEARKTEMDEKRKYAMEYASNVEKVKELKKMMEEANYEYKDRNKRYLDTQSDLKLARSNLIQLEDALSKCEQANRVAQDMLNKLKNRKELLENLMKEPFNHQRGVKAVMNAKDNLQGVIDVVSSLLVPHNNYEEAITSALGGALYHIVTQDASAARHAITYLKKNQSGKATFLPMNVLRDRGINRDHEILAENCVGYLGCASQFVDNDSEFDVLKSSLLGNVLVSDNLINANELAKLLKYNYKIVTLEGDIVHRGGSMSGGKVRDAYSPLTLKKDLDQIISKLEGQQMLYNQLQNERSDLKSKNDKLNDDIVQYQISLAQLKPIVDAKQAKYDRLKIEYEQIAPADDSDEVSMSDDIVIKLSKAYGDKDNAENEMKQKRDRRSKAGQESERYDLQIRELRRELNTLQNDERSIELDQVKGETQLENALERLSATYEMTFEHAQTLKQDIDMQEARASVASLRSEIAALGNVNLDAPKEYEEVSGRFEFLSKQKQDLEDARTKILSAIDEMDGAMITQFKDMFDRINHELNDVFRALFGGGRAELVMVDPTDILNTGIDIDVQPPGKDVQNIRLFSGGEKSLIAICVLFSILKARTMPLCIFDEVEAALDQANVERFAKYISQFRGESQFIVVTHRPGTMAQCDALYGVTMQQSGVSQLLKVKLQDAIQIVDKPKVVI
ncbi:MAG: chromosome segregation protein SMC [Erysipelotrichaceae bacterium]